MRSTLADVLEVKLQSGIHKTHPR